MSWGELHDWSVDLGIYRLCSKCARADLVATRQQHCRPLPAEAIGPAIMRKVAMARQFRGTPAGTSRPVAAKWRSGSKKMGLP